MTLDLKAEHKILLALATSVQKNAYAPYSNFYVAAFPNKQMLSNTIF